MVIVITIIITSSSPLSSSSSSWAESDLLISTPVICLHSLPPLSINYISSLPLSPNLSYFTLIETSRMLVICRIHHWTYEYWPINQHYDRSRIYGPARCPTIPQIRHHHHGILWKRSESNRCFGDWSKRILPFHDQFRVFTVQWYWWFVDGEYDTKPNTFPKPNMFSKPNHKMLDDLLMVRMTINLLCSPNLICSLVLT